MHDFSKPGPDSILFHAMALPVPSDPVFVVELLHGAKGISTGCAMDPLLVVSSSAKLK